MSKLINTTNIIIIILIILVILFLFKNKRENYDARISNVDNIEKCANMCSSVYGCGGFAYNTNDNKCYLSKFPLASPVVPSLYSNEFTKSNVYCNKSLPILSSEPINEDLYVDNKVYDCYVREAEDLGKKYYDFNKPGKQIYFNDLYGLKSEPYNIQKLEWPMKQVDLKFDDKFNLYYDTKDIVYEADNMNEYIGTYLNPSMCQTDINQNKCLKDCTLNADCIGVEYNPVYKIYKNVCCPKSKIEKIIPRSEEKLAGTFYMKQLNLKDDTKNNIII
jgi:hypothetical protein